MSMEAKGGQCLNWRQLAGKVWGGEEEFTPVSPDGEDVLRIAKKMDRTNQDVVDENCARSDTGELAVPDKDKMKHGLTTVQVVQCRIWVAKQRAPWVSQLLPPSQCVCNPDP